MERSEAIAFVHGPLVAVLLVIGFISIVAGLYTYFNPSGVVDDGNIIGGNIVNQSVYKFWELVDVVPYYDSPTYDVAVAGWASIVSGALLMLLAGFIRGVSKKALIILLIVVIVVGWLLFIPTGFR